MDDRPLRHGFTTGTCAAAAAQAAAVMLLTGRAPVTVTIMTPAGYPARLEIQDPRMDASMASCAVKKDAGDDPDVTDKALVYAKISYIDSTPVCCYQSETCSGLWLGGGKGVGMVTRPGLSCPVGMPAINPVPRRMIFQQVEEILRKDNGFNPVSMLIEISIPDGVELAEKTFNPKLGIEGGISVLGTSGIVSPMSEQALLDTIRLEIHQKMVLGGRDTRLIFAPGNYGMDFLEQRLHICLEHGVKTSNFIADSIEIAAEEGVKEILFAGHLGKLIKVANKSRNTHSKYGDGRMETLARLTQISMEERKMEDEGVLNRILFSNTTEEVLGILVERGLAQGVMDLAARLIRNQMELWSGGKIRIEVVTFSTSYDILGRANWRDGETDGVQESVG